MQTTTTVPSHHDNHPEEEQYANFLLRVKTRFENAASGPLFTTDVENLFEVFLDHLPPERRQHYNCRSCQFFINRFGTLVTIDEDGSTQSAAWSVDDAPSFFRFAVEVMLRTVRRAKVTGIFLSSERTLGHPVTPSAKGTWYHLHGLVPAVRLHKSRLLTAGQAAAEKREDYNNVIRALQEYKLSTLDVAVKLLNSEALYRSEKVLGQATWLQKVQAERTNSSGQVKNNKLWLAVAQAPAGFCHPRSSMIGTLLDDIEAGLPFADVSKKFADKMHPLQYQRPQAAPAAGNIAEAEKIFEKLGLAPALERRYAKLEDIETIWKPKLPRMVPRRAGVFGDVKAKGEEPAKANSLKLPRTTITWEKFQRTVLPTAEKIEYFVNTLLTSYAAYVTAVNPDAPPILQWDREEKRNTVSWYLWGNDSAGSQWNLPLNHFVPVTGISFKPSMWGEKPLAHQGEGVLFVLEGARDTREAGSALFPEILRSELHGVRAVIEAHSKGASIADADTASACGIMFVKNNRGGDYVFRVNGDQEYRLDRWD